MADEARARPPPTLLEPAHWAVLRAFELGDLRFRRMDADIAFLEQLGYMELQAGEWRLTADGRTLIALRRHV